MMEKCNGVYAYLNGQYDGLALPTTSSYWDYGLPASYVVIKAYRRDSASSPDDVGNHSECPRVCGSTTPSC